LSGEFADLMPEEFVSNYPSRGAVCDPELDDIASDLHRKLDRQLQCCLARNNSHAVCEFSYGTHLRMIASSTPNG
jgi:hypothetical protein